MAVAFDEDFGGVESGGTAVVTEFANGEERA